MRFKYGILIGIALVTLGASPAGAQWFVTPYAGGQFGGDTRDNNFNVGAGIGFLGGGIAGFEADLNYAPNFFSNSDNVNFNDKSTNLSTIMFNAMLAGSKHWGARPYGSGGVGWIRSSVPDVATALNVNNNDFGFNLGGGLIAQFNEHVGWRTDLRYFRAVGNGGINSSSNFSSTDTGSFSSTGNFDFWRATAGVTFGF